MGLEVQGGKAVWVDTGSRAVLPTILRTQNQSPCQSGGWRFVGWVQSLGGVRCLGTSLMLWMQSEIADCILAYSIFFFSKEKNSTWFFEDIRPVPTWILPEDDGRAFSSTSIVLAAGHVMQSSSRVRCTRLGLSSLVFLRSSALPPWSGCTKTLLSGNIGLSSKSKHFQEKTWKSIFSVSTPLYPPCCRLLWLVVKLPTLLLI